MPGASQEGLCLLCCTCAVFLSPDLLRCSDAEVVFACTFVGLLPLQLQLCQSLWYTGC
jgi:hypothetical protein